jgi:hypothetical protein
MAVEGSDRDVIEDIIPAYLCRDTDIPQTISAWITSTRTCDLQNRG